MNTSACFTISEYEFTVLRFSNGWFGFLLRLGDDLICDYGNCLFGLMIMVNWDNFNMTDDMGYFLSSSCTADSVSPDDICWDALGMSPRVLFFGVSMQWRYCSHGDNYFQIEQKPFVCLNDDFKREIFKSLQFIHKFSN